MIRSRSLNSSPRKIASGKPYQYESIDQQIRYKDLKRNTWKSLICIGILFALFVYATSKSFDFNHNEKISAVGVKDENLKVSTWNVASINNNPFEYWIEVDEKSKYLYNTLMDKMQETIESPGDVDKNLREIFPQEYFDRLITEMNNAGLDNIDWVIKQWNENYKDRKIVSGFLKDPELGLKRLVSMPDRVTNTVIKEGKKQKSFFRPSVINCYRKKFVSKEEFFDQWLDFMFRFRVFAGDTVAVHNLKSISKAKYPAITTEEEQISKSLQILVLAAFDLILVDILGTLFDGDQNPWQTLRRDICKNLNLYKNVKVLQILGKRYSDRDIILLQEVSEGMLQRMQSRKKLSYILNHFDIYQPLVLSKSHQSSVILLRREKFPSKIAKFESCTKEVKALMSLNDRDMVSDGDLLVIKSSYFKIVVASFHGDTNGLASVPVVKAVSALMAQLGSDYALIFGLDANTYEFPKVGKNQGFVDFVQFYHTLGLTSCWEKYISDIPIPNNYTTYSARTFLQPQLNKASKREEFYSKGDVNPKDFILFTAHNFKASTTFKDNTGKRYFKENTIFPSFKFPSDHAILSTELEISGW